MSKWFLDQRLSFIEAQIQEVGYITRKAIIEKFDISSAQATRDITLFRNRNSDALEYNVSMKRYERKR